MFLLFNAVLFSLSCYLPTCVSPSGSSSLLPYLLQAILLCNVKKEPTSARREMEYTMRISGKGQQGQSI